MFLSVIICTYNRDQHIGRALDSLIKQDYDKNDFEIIIVDNNSTDKTAEIISSFKRKHSDFNITTAKETQQGLSFGRNKGISLARGTYLSYIDDDGIAKKDYVSQIKHYTEQYPDYLAMGGKVLPTYETGIEPNWMSKYIERIISVVNLGDEVKELHKTYPVGCNMIFKKEIFDRVGRFNTELKLRSDDKYIFLKIRQEGFKVLYLPKVVVWHFIDAFRTTPEYVKKVSRLNGEAEYIRIKSTGKNCPWSMITRLLDYLFKVSASLALWLIYTLKGQSIKGKMLFISLWKQFKGFVSRPKF
jgi:glycosyltransferase involved in cell wall biosynthesis